MVSKAFLNYNLKLIILFSVVLNPIYNLLSFISPSIPEYYYSWFISTSVVADFSTLGFIAFFITLVLAYIFVEKITNDITVVLTTLLTGLFLLLISFTTIFELYFLLIIIGGALSGLALPIIFEFIIKNIYPEQESRINSLSTLTIFLGFIGVSFLLFWLFGMLYWRYIYLITALLIILASFYVAKLVSIRRE